MNHIEANLTEPQGNKQDNRWSRWRSPRGWAALGLLLAAAVGVLWAGRYVQTVYAQETQPPPYTRVQFRMTAPNLTANEQFGYALAMERSGGRDYALVGSSGGAAAGTAYVWELQGNGRDWAQTANLQGADTAAGDLFGRSVELSRNFAVVGAPGQNAGAAYLFNRLGATPWEQVNKLTADPVAGDNFGSSVDVWGDPFDPNNLAGRVIVGAPNKDGDTGAAYVAGRHGWRNANASAADQSGLRCGRSVWQCRCYLQQSGICGCAWGKWWSGCGLCVRCEHGWPAWRRPGCTRWSGR